MIANNKRYCNFIQDEESLRRPQPDCELTVTSTDPDDPNRPWYHLSQDPDGNVVAEEIPWELREDPEEDRNMDELKKELSRKKRAFVINAIGTVAYISGAAIAMSMGKDGYMIFMLMSIGLFCMDRK